MMVTSRRTTRWAPGSRGRRVRGPCRPGPVALRARTDDSGRRQENHEHHPSARRWRHRPGRPADREDRLRHGGAHRGRLGRAPYRRCRRVAPAPREGGGRPVLRYRGVLRAGPGQPAAGQGIRIAPGRSGVHDGSGRPARAGSRADDGGAASRRAAQRPDELRQAVEANLRSLGTDRLDLVHLRRMDMPPGLVITDPQQLVDLDDQLAALEALRESGTIGAIGLSHVSLAQLERALPAGISAVSNIYNLLDRTHEPLLRLAETGAMVWAPTSRSGRRLSRAARPQPAVAGHRRHLLRRPSRREHRRSDPATAAGGARPARCRGLSAMSHRPACSSQRVPPRTRRGDSLSCEP